MLAEGIDISDQAGGIFEVSNFSYEYIVKQVPTTIYKNTTSTTKLQKIQHPLKYHVKVGAGIFFCSQL